MARNKRFTVKEYGTFKTEFTRWQRRFGLDGYKVYFKFEPIEDCFADITADQRQSCVTIRVNSEVPPADVEFADVKVHAKHEAIHLLVKRLSARAYERHVRGDEIYEAEEELVRRLEKLIPD